MRFIDMLLALTCIGAAAAVVAVINPFYYGLGASGFVAIDLSSGYRPTGLTSWGGDIGWGVSQMWAAAIQAPGKAAEYLSMLGVPTVWIMAVSTVVGAVAGLYLFYVITGRSVE